MNILRCLPFQIVLILAIVIAMSLTGCSAYKAKVCLTCATNTIIKDSISYEIKEKIKEVRITDTVKVTVVLPNPCTELCDQQGQLKKGFKKTLTSDKGTSSTLYERNGQLAISNEITGLKTKGLINDTTVKEFHSKTEQVPTCFKEHRTKFDGFTFWWFWITCSLLFLLIVSKMVKYMK